MAIVVERVRPADPALSPVPASGESGLASPASYAGPQDPYRPYTVRKVRELLRDLSSEEAAVSQDGVDLNLNPRHQLHVAGAGSTSGRRDAMDQCR